MATQRNAIPDDDLLRKNIETDRAPRADTAVPAKRHKVDQLGFGGDHPIAVRIAGEIHGSDIIAGPGQTPEARRGNGRRAVIRTIQTGPADDRETAGIDVDILNRLQPSVLQHDSHAGTSGLCRNFGPADRWHIDRGICQIKAKLDLEILQVGAGRQHDVATKLT